MAGYRNNNRKNFVRRDRFGRPTHLVGMKDKKGNGFPYGYLTLGNKTFKVEVSDSNKDGVEQWVKLTEMAN